MSVGVAGALSALAAYRPVFHSEHDFQHALAWQIQQASPAARIRLETRPRRGIHLDLLVHLDGTSTAIELKYLLTGLRSTVGGELFDLPHQSANDISRHDVVKDITRVEAMLADGYADRGCVLVLTNDRGYWLPGARADTIDAEFRLHEGRVLESTLRWADRAGTGTIVGRDAPLSLTGRYTCRWRDYSQVRLDSGRAAIFRYLLINVGRGQAGSPTLQDAGPEMQPAPPAPGLSPAASTPRPAGSAREEILATARKLAGRCPDGSFTLMEIIAETRRSGSRHAESTIGPM